MREAQPSAMAPPAAHTVTAVYLTTARKLGIDPTACVAVEDSPNGLLSGKAAGMKCIAVPEPALGTDPRFALADATVASLGEIGPDLWDRLQAV